MERRDRHVAPMAAPSDLLAMTNRNGSIFLVFVSLLAILTIATPVWADQVEETGEPGLAQITPTPVFCNNMIQGWGFEQGEGNYPGAGKYWETNDAQPHPEVNFLDSEIKHSGNYSQHLAAHPEWDRGMLRQITNYGSVQAGKTYRLQAWVRTANVQNPAGWYVLGIWWFQNDTWLADVKMDRPETNNYDWRLITIEAVAPPGANRAGVVLTRHTDGDAWYDDINLVEVGQECTPTPTPNKVKPSLNLH